MFEVIDNGVGIKAEDRPNLFRLFGMVEAMRDKINTKGNGLGLVICE